MVMSMILKGVYFGNFYYQLFFDIAFYFVGFLRAYI